MTLGIFRAAQWPVAFLFGAACLALPSACGDDATDATIVEQDTVVLDTGVPTDTVADADDVDDTTSDLLTAGFACSTHEACESGVCALGPEGRICVAACDDAGACLDGLFCGSVQGSKGIVQACLPVETTACAPCREDADCAPRGEPAVCVAFGDEGSFCLVTCAEDAARCGEGGACNDGTCLPAGDRCGCSVYAVIVEASTTCASDSEAGRCVGTRRCEAEGLTECSAEAAIAEVCDGIDSDCDGETDEGACDDSDPCTTDTCDPATGCVFTASSGADCDDGDICTENDLCDAGKCAGAAIDCDDSDACTADSCDAASGCVNAGIDCDDRDACTADSCDTATGCVNAGIDCDDSDACTADSCDTATGCVNAGIDCDDRDACTADSCDTATGCVNAGIDCDDSDACTADSCDTATGCVNAGIDCDDSDACTADSCDTATGCVNAGIDCDDSDACTADSCVTATGCVNAGIDCDDSDACTADSCDTATGCVNADVVCDDQDACTTDRCDPVSGCVYTDNPGSDCDDNNPCTDDVCDAALGCLNRPVAGSCDDGNACTTAGTCFEGACLPSAEAISCDDSNPCTGQQCDSTLGCTYPPLDGPCDDTDPCTATGVCTDGQCVPGGPVDCADDNPCTADSCVTGFGCVHPPAGGDCDDSDPCTFNEFCDGTTCTPQTTIDCDDGNPCTTDSCTADQGCTYMGTGLSCVDDPDYPDFCEQVGAERVVEPNDTSADATLTASGQTHQSTIDTDDDQDEYVIWTCGERILQVTFDNVPAVSSAVDYDLKFYTSSRDRRHQRFDSNGGNGTTRLAFNAYTPEAGPVWVQVEDFGSNNSDVDNPYNVRIEALPVPDADLEPNNVRAEATPLVDGQVVTAYMASLDDADWFSIDVPGERILRATLTTDAPSGTQVDYDMEFFNDNGFEFQNYTDQNGEDGPTNLAVNVYIETAGTYYVKVRDFFDNEWDYDLPYTLTLSVLEVPDADIEPNGNSFASNTDRATTLTDGVSQRACIAHYEDEDWFVLDVPGESILDVQLSNAPAIASAVDYDVTVRDRFNNVLNSLTDQNGSNGTTNINIYSYAVDAGLYYVKVRDFFDNDWDYSQCYDLSVTIRPVPDVDDEPNNTRAEAVRITEGNPHTSYLASLDDADWFDFEVPGERIIQILFEMEQGPVDPDVAVYGLAEIASLIDQNGGNAPSRLNIAAYAPDAGVYAAKLRDFFDNEWGYSQAYTIELRLHLVPDADTEPNETRGTAVPIGAPGSVTAYHASIKDSDWWSFTAPASGSVTVTLTTSMPTNTDYDVDLYNNVGGRVAGDADPDGSNAPTRISFSAAVTAGETYTVRVQDSGTNDAFDLAIPYELTVTP